MTNETALRLTQHSPFVLPRGLAIITEIIPATDNKPAYIRAYCKRDSETVFRARVSWDSLSGEGLERYYSVALDVLRKIENWNEYFSFRVQSVASTAEGYIFTTEALER